MNVNIRPYCKYTCQSCHKNLEKETFAVISGEDFDRYYCGGKCYWNYVSLNGGPD